jgi:hypothetical protein
VVAKETINAGIDPVNSSSRESASYSDTQLTQPENERSKGHTAEAGAIPSSSPRRLFVQAVPVPYPGKEGTRDPGVFANEDRGVG